MWYLFITLIHREEIIANAEFTLHCCQELSIPTLITEHAKRVFGNTVATLRDTALKNTENCRIVEKTQFSMCVDQVRKALRSEKPFVNRKTIILIGIETHICALQTALDLIDNGYNVYYVVDCGGSLRSKDELYALRRMESVGVILTTSESIVFQLVGDASHPQFKKISKHVKKHINDLKKFQIQSKL